MSGVGATVGRVKWFNGRKGFGFVTTVGEETSEDVFVHHSAVTVDEEQYRYLVEGEYISFDLAETDSDSNSTHKYQASNVRGVCGGKLMCETRNEQRDTREPRESWQTVPERRSQPRRRTNTGDDRRRDR